MANLEKKPGAILSKHLNYDGPFSIIWNKKAHIVYGFVLLNENEMKQQKKKCCKTDK